MFSPASVLGENDRHAEMLTPRESEQTRERWCEHRREKRPESVPCAKEKTQPVTE